MFGVDKDTKSQLRLLTTFINASSIGVTNVFDTNHGCHFKTEHDCSTEASLRLRSILYDDKKRLEFDEKKVHFGLIEMSDKLFEGKRGDGQKWHFEEPVENVLALPFWSTARARKNPDRKLRKHRNRRRRRSRLTEVSQPKKYSDEESLWQYFRKRMGEENYKEMLSDER